MERLMIVLALLGYCSALPQFAGSAPKENPFVKILNFESFQNGADFGHNLEQEDGTSTGQKIGPDGLVYGFYSYIQDGGNPVKVYYRAGKGVGYEVLRVDGIDQSTLGNLKATVSSGPQEPSAPSRTHSVQPQPAPRQPRPFRPSSQQPSINHNHVNNPITPQQFLPAPQPQPPVFRQPAPAVSQINPLTPVEPTPAPHRFDYPANLNLQRTGSGFRSSFKAL